MDDMLDIVFEGILEILAAAIESDSVPKVVRHLVLGLVLLPVLILIGLIAVQTHKAYIAVILIMIAVGLIAGGVFIACRIHRSGECKLARREELPQILAMYRKVIGKPGCPWDIFYPNETTLREDFDSGNLYVLRRGKQLIGAGSVVSENELDDLDCWSIREDARELARIVIDPCFQGKGYGKQLVRKLCRQLDITHCRTIHILVAKENHHALNLYRSIGFRSKGECHRYDHDYYAYEKIL